MVGSVAERDSRRGTRLVAGAMLIDTLGSGMLAPFELVYAHHVLGLPLTTAGAIMTAAAALGMAVGPAAGSLADRLGPAKVAAASNAAQATGCAVLLSARGGWGFAAAALLFSGGTRAFWAAYTPLVVSVAEPRDLERWFGRLRAVRYAGLAAGQGLAGVILLHGQTSGLRVIVAADGLSFVGGFALMTFVSRRNTRTATAVRPGPPTSSGYGAALRDRTNVALALLNVACTFLIVAPFLAMPVYVMDVVGLGAWLPGPLGATATAAVVAGAVASGRLLAGRNRLTNLAIAAAVWSGGLCVMALSGLGGSVAVASLFAGMTLLGVGEAVYAPTADALPAALAPSGLAGRYAALHQMAWGVSETAAPLAASWLVSAHPQALWWVFAAGAAVTSAGYAAARRTAGTRAGVAGEPLPG